MPGQVSAELVFPATQRVLYAQNPLVEVICQLRFPAILKIDSATPAGFQERIRDSFPLLSEEEQVLPVELPPEILQFFKANRSPQLMRKAWKFMSEDRNWTISLTREFASLSTQKYTRWEGFKTNLELMRQALQEEYRPNFMTRTGLRYRDLITRSSFGLTDVPWSELLQKHIAAEYSAARFADAIKDTTHQILAEFPEERLKLGLRHGTDQLANAGEQVYFIDADFYSDEKTEVDNVLSRLDIFNHMAGRLFRWCITDRLHAAMEPTAL